MMQLALWNGPAQQFAETFGVDQVSNGYLAITAVGCASISATYTALVMAITKRMLEIDETRVYQSSR